jgi:hypothetical protein
MAFKQNKESSTPEVGPGKQKYSSLKRMFREGYLSVCVYKNVYEHKTFYDVVIYRKIRIANGEYDYRRGANLKPSDLPVLQQLLKEVSDFLETLEEP